MNPVRNSTNNNILSNSSPFKISNGVKILIAAGIFPPDIGGPAQYAKYLSEEFKKRGNAVKILHYKTEKKLPTGIRHFLYFFRILFSLAGVDLVIALDTFSVGLPAVAAVRLLGKKIIVRLGGDFLWESYVERTGNLITLKEFYEKKLKLSVKEKIIHSAIEFVLDRSSALVFSTNWQKEIFEKVYKISPDRSYIIENFYGEKIKGFEPREKNFIWAGRPLKLKNLKILKAAFDEIKEENSGIKLENITNLPHEELLERLKSCYAVILPSISEVSPNFILDAISTNKPFILTKEAGFYEKLKDIGIFVDPHNREDITNKILFLADENNYQEYKKRIADFKFVHSWQQIADDFLNIYQKL